MILHELSRSCCGVSVHFDVVVMPGMLWLYIGDSEIRFDALSFAAGTQGQKIPTSSCLMKGVQEDIGSSPSRFIVACPYEPIFQAKSCLNVSACERVLGCFAAAISTVPCPHHTPPSHMRLITRTASVPFLLESVEAEVPGVLKEVGVM